MLPRSRQAAPHAFENVEGAEDDGELAKAGISMKEVTDSFWWMASSYLLTRFRPCWTPGQKRRVRA